jgi:adenylosuccinate synthase
LGWGDEGKGSVVDWLARDTGAAGVVRFNGGPQAAHHVVVGDHFHCFAQFGAGTFAGARTFLASPVATDLLALRREAQTLAAAGIAKPLGLMTIHPDVVLVTPWHKLVNRLLEELRGDDRHGSCGMGVGQALLDAEKPAMPTIRMCDVEDDNGLRRSLRHLWLVKVDQAEQAASGSPHLARAAPILEDLRDPTRVDALVDEYRIIANQLTIGDALSGFLREGPVIFEGAQGVLLDRIHGDFPYVTPSYVTPNVALDLLEGHIDRDLIRVLGVTRTYATRHGPGPFPTEDEALTLALPEEHNGKNPWQGPMRAGRLHLPSLRRALAACKGEVDGLAVTCLDRVSDTLGDIKSLGVPIEVLSAGPTASDKTTDD